MFDNNNMNRKKLFILSLLILEFVVIGSSININVSAQAYTLNLSENEEFIWQITELDLHIFKKVFGFEPDFEVGNQIKKLIRSIISTPNTYSLTVEEWDYGSNFNGNGTLAYYSVQKDPKNFNEEIFIPVPVADYLSEVDRLGILGSEYTLSGTTLKKRDKGVDGTRYTMTKIYDSRGILATEMYTDDDKDNRVIVRVDGTFIIPLGNTFFVFTGFSIIAVIFILIKKKQFHIKRN